MIRIDRVILFTAVSFAALLLLQAVIYWYGHQNVTRRCNAELNDFYHRLMNGEKAETILSGNPQYVKGIDFLFSNRAKTETALAFFSGYGVKTDFFRVYPFNAAQTPMDSIPFTETGSSAVPLTEPAPGYVRLSYKAAPPLYWGSFLITGSAAAVSIGLLLYIKRRIIRPYEQLSQAADDISAGVERTRPSEPSPYFYSLFRSIYALDKTLRAQRSAASQREKEHLNFLTSVTHNIRTPVQAIRLNAQALANGLYPDENDRRECVDRIISRTRQTDEMLKDLLAKFTEIPMEREPERQIIYPSALLDGIKERWEKELAVQGITFSTECSCNRIIHSDWAMLTEIGSHILINAVKYGDGGAISINTDEEENRLLVRFRNTGPPVPDHEIPYIFNNYWRGSNAQNIGGSGVGLYKCRKLTRLLDGEIFYEYKNGWSEFCLLME